MSTFIVKKRVDLSFLGEGWTDAYIVFSPLTWNDQESMTSLRSKVIKMEKGELSEEESKKVSGAILDRIKKQLIEGQGYDGTKLIKITPDNFEELPMEVIIHCINELTSGLKKNNPTS